MKRMTLFFCALFVIANLSSCEDNGKHRSQVKNCPDEYPQKERERKW